MQLEMIEYAKHRGSPLPSDAQILIDKKLFLIEFLLKLGFKDDLQVVEIEPRNIHKLLEKLVFGQSQKCKLLIQTFAFLLGLTVIDNAEFLFTYNRNRNT